MTKFNTGWSSCVVWQKWLTAIWAWSMLIWLCMAQDQSVKN